MKTEEAVRALKNAIKKPNTKARYLGPALNMAIKALEGETCEDCVSREEVEDAIANMNVNGEILGYGVASAILHNLSSVVPQQKIGHWVKIGPYPMQTHEYAFSECYHETHDNTENYCSECGARMVDKPESEDKE